jgi:polysaccharide biosynthesis/export protein
MPTSPTTLSLLLVTAVAFATGVSVGAQPAAPPRTAVPPTPAATPSDFVIGPEDVLGVVFWREAELSGDVTVRPDGRISLPVIGELAAAGLRPDELQKQIVSLASKYINEPNVAVVMRAINSRKVFVTGRVAEPGTFDIRGPMDVMQAIALAGGLTDYADAKNITILRKGGAGPAETLRFNYRDVARGKRLEQNVTLRPGDTIVVP